MINLSNETQRIQDGLRRLANGDYQQVHSAAITMIQQNVNDPVPYLLLGRLSFEHNNHSKALQLHQKAAELAPDNVYCLSYYAQILSQSSHQNEAKIVADEAAQLKPKDAHLADTIGVVYSRTGFHELAIPFFEQAVNANPEPANYHYNLAASLQFLGEFERAKHAYLATLKRDPSAYRALASIVNLNKQSHEDNHIDKLLAAFKLRHKDDDAALHLGHALAKTYEDLGDYETSLEWLHKAKAGKLSHDSQITYKDIFTAAKTTVTTNQAHNSQRSAEAPIFVVGMPRTGTTLVDRIISSHQEVNAAGELNLFAGLVKQATTSPSNLVMDAATFAASQTIDLGQVGQHYIAATQDLRRNAKRFTDKMPLNFFYAALIHHALPNARIVALRRSAMDSCLSNYRQLLTVQHSYYNYTYDLSATAAFYRQFDDLMTHWRTHLPSNRFMEIHYEDIVYDQENQTRKLLSFCGLEWDEACMNFHRNSAPVSTASSVQVRQPLYSGSIGRWQRYGDKLDDLAAALGDLAS